MSYFEAAMGMSFFECSNLLVHCRIFCQFTAIIPVISGCAGNIKKIPAVFASIKVPQWFAVERIATQR
jgi:hypothetical protein